MLFGFGNTDLAFRKTSPLHSPSQKRKYSLTARPFAVPNPSAKTARGRRRRRSTAPSQRKGPRPVQGEQLPDATFPIERRREGADRGDRGVGVEADVVERPRPTIVDVRERPGVARVVFRRGSRRPGRVLRDAGGRRGARPPAVLKPGGGGARDTDSEYDRAFEATAWWSSADDGGNSKGSIALRPRPRGGIRRGVQPPKRNAGTLKVEEQRKGRTGD